MKRIALVSANFGRLDPVFPLPAHPQIDGLYFVDHTVKDPGAWRIVRDNSTKTGTRRKSKRYKCQIHRVDGVAAYDYIAWVDASIEIRDPSFLAEAAEYMARADLEAAFVPHPSRATAAEEYEHLIAGLRDGVQYLVRRYGLEPLLAEREQMRSRGYDLSAPLWAGGVWIVANAPRVWAMLDKWWHVVRRFSVVDQPALACLVQSHGIRHTALALNLYDNRFFRRKAHA